jgi:hypothetical protein
VIQADLKTPAGLRSAILLEIMISPAFCSGLTCFACRLSGPVGTIRPSEAYIIDWFFLVSFALVKCKRFFFWHASPFSKNFFATFLLHCSNLGSASFLVASISLYTSNYKRPTGIEPASSAWKAEVMPLYHRRSVYNGLYIPKIGVMVKQESACTYHRYPVN